MLFRSKLKAWDIAAGVLLIQEAGGVVTDFSGGDNYLQSGNVLAGNPRIHSAMFKVLKETLPDSMRQ